MSTEKTNARNRHAAPIGLVFIVLCVIGLCTVFNWCYGLTRNLADNTAQKTKYEQMLLPVVMFDPPKNHFRARGEQHNGAAAAHGRHIFLPHGDPAAAGDDQRSHRRKAGQFHDG